MDENAGHLGVVDRAEWSTPNMKIWIKDGDDPIEVHEDDVVFVLRESLVQEMKAVDIISSDKIISITPHQFLIEKSLMGGLF